MPRHDRIRLRRELRFKRVKQLITQRRQTTLSQIVQRDVKTVRLMKALRFRLREVHDTIAKSIVYVRSEKRRKALLEIAYFANAVRRDIDRLIARYEHNMVQVYGIDRLHECIDRIVQCARSGMSGLPVDVDDLTHELAHHYYAPINPSHYHFTANMIRLTDLTIQFMQGMKAELYTAYRADLHDVASPFIRVANVLLQLAEFLEMLMRKKGRREKVKNKARGHYGVIKYDEPVHTIININLTPVDSLPLDTLLGNTYEFAREKAISLGRPELATKFIALAVFAIPERRVFKKYTFETDDLFSYTYRVTKHRYW